MEIKKGIAVSPGIYIGKALIIDSEDYRIPRRSIEPAQRADEVKRLRKAFGDAIDDLIQLEAAHFYRWKRQIIIRGEISLISQITMHS